MLVLEIQDAVLDIPQPLRGAQPLAHGEDAEPTAASRGAGACGYADGRGTRWDAGTSGIECGAECWGNARRRRNEEEETKEEKVEDGEDGLYWCVACPECSVS